MDIVKPVVQQIAVPRCLRNLILKGWHDENCHAGFDRLYASIKERYYWPLMYLQTKTFVETCATCQASKRPIRPHNANLHPLPVHGLFHTWSVDIIGPISPASSPGGARYIILAVEHLSAWPEAIPLVSTEASVVAKVLYDNIFVRYGCPYRILSDRGANFVSTLVSELCKLFKVKRALTSSYHPMTNGKNERLNSYLWQALRSCCDKYENWAEYLAPILMAYRATVSVATSKFAPFFVLFGKNMVLPIDNVVVPSTPTGKITADRYIEQMLPKLEVTRKLAQENMERYKMSYMDRTARPFVYTPGTRVWIHDPKVLKGVSDKLRRKWIGPYYITIMGPKDTYWLRRCSDNRAHPSIVHSNRLKLYSGEEDRDNLFSQWSDGQGVTESQDSDIGITLPHPAEENAEESVESTKETEKINPDEYFTVDRLLACKIINGTCHYKVKWADKNSRPTWEPEHHVSDHLKREFHINKTYQGKSRKHRTRK